MLYLAISGWEDSHSPTSGLCCGFATQCECGRLWSDLDVAITCVWTKHADTPKTPPCGSTGPTWQLSHTGFEQNNYLLTSNISNQWCQALQLHEGHKYLTEDMFTYLCAHNFPIRTVASVTVFIPFDSVEGDVSINRARFSHHCGRHAPIISEMCFCPVVLVL